MSQVSRRDLAFLAGGAVSAVLAYQALLAYQARSAGDGERAEGHAAAVATATLHGSSSTSSSSASSSSSPSSSAAAAATGGIQVKCEAGTTTGVHLIDAEKLRSFVKDVLVRCGCDAEDAATGARILVLADLRGIDSHGVARLKAYYSMLSENIINPRPNVRIVRETASTATVDGDNGLGLIVGPKANKIAMDKAQACGSGWVSVRNTHHYGIAGAYSLMALERDMIGLSMTNSSSVVAPLWGKERMLGTNPIAIAFPGQDERPVVIDFATSVVPWGKVEEYARMGKPLLPGWAIDANGREALTPEGVRHQESCVTQLHITPFIHALYTFVTIYVHLYAPVIHVYTTYKHLTRL